LTSLSQLHSVTIIHTFNSSWIPNPSLLPVSCASDLPEFSRIPTSLPDFSLLASDLNSAKSESESYVTVDGESTSLSWNKAPIWGLWSDFYYRRTIAGLLMWGVLFDERTGLSFTAAAGPRQRINFGSEFRWTRDHILLPLIRDFLFVASYDSQGYGGGIRPRLHTGMNLNSAEPSVRYYLRWSDGLEDTFSKGSVFYFSGNSLPIYRSSGERVYNCHPDNDAFPAPCLSRCLATDASFVLFWLCIPGFQAARHGIVNYSSKFRRRNIFRSCCGSLGFDTM
jgi:hypothetical protein